MSDNDELHQIYISAGELRWLWDTCNEVIEDRVRELVNSKAFKKDGTPNKNRKHYGVYLQSRLNDLESARDMKNFIETIPNFTTEDGETL